MTCTSPKTLSYDGVTGVGFMLIGTALTVCNLSLKIATLAQLNIQRSQELLFGSKTKVLKN